VSQKIPRLRFSGIFPKWLGILVQILHTYYSFLSTLDYNFFYPIIYNFDQVMPYSVRPPSMCFNRWWTFRAYNGSRT